MKQLFLGIGLQTRDSIPWGNRNQKMNFKFARFLPGDAFRTATKESRARKQQSGWRKQKSAFQLLSPLQSLGRIPERRELHREAAPEISRGVSLGPCPDTKPDLCRAGLCMPRPRAAVGKLWGKWRFQRCLVLEDVRIQPARVAMRDNSGVQPNLASWPSRLRRRTALGLESGLPWNCHNKHTWSSVRKRPPRTFPKGRPQNLDS